MQRDGELIVNRKGELCVVAKLDLVTGTVQGHPDGFGFLVPDDGGDDLFLSPREMHKVLHGDRATARRIGIDRRGRPEGEIVEVLERANRDVVGRLHEERGVWFVVAENRRISQDLLIPPDEPRQRASRARWWSSRSSSSRREHREAVARVKEVLGSATDPGMEIEIALRKHDAAARILAAAERAGEASCPTDVRPADRKGRIDLTHLPLVTIDGETAKDFDDAVYCERDGQRLPPDRRDRRRRRTTSATAMRSTRRARARHVGLFSAARDPDAARGAVERAVLAQARRRPPVHGLRHGGSTRAGRDHGVRVLPGGDALARAAHLHAGLAVAVASPTAATAARRARRCCRISRNLYALYKVLLGAREATRRDRLRHASSWQLEFDEHGQDRAHRARRRATTRTS